SSHRKKPTSDPVVGHPTTSLNTSLPTTRTRLMMDMRRLHGILHAWEEVRSRRQTVQMKKAICTGLVSEPQIFGRF
ncbi:MAG: hypothetical protein WCB23_01595, partial [Pseudolabrys sp.]